MLAAPGLSPGRLGCGAFLWIAVIVGIVGACQGSGSDSVPPASPSPVVSDPGYTDSLCEGSDHALYDDCK
ncbi:hypothetical protein DY218_08375 [Streptomyces triticagri]|uniref:Uncharacterized protein n=1 Tax=Streptomyces triticagri TaxID=2293568 RepID=A0A372MA54_9ACTN|nr:hypothetical protein DY218_08375 [Streptomyces triticagri]